MMETLCALASKKAYLKGTVVDNNAILHDESIVAIRGSDEGWRYWIEPVETSFAEILPILLDSLDYGSTYILTGHSKGGAIATLATWHLRKMGYNIASCYTFGMPKVVPSYVNTHAVHIYNLNDWVAYLPPWRGHPKGGETRIYPWAKRNPHSIDSYIGII